MSVVAIEGIVENGRIRLESEVRLPENTRVYALVPGMQAPPGVREPGPRLAHPEQVADFQMEVIPELPDARV